MSRIGRVVIFTQLAAVVTIDKQAQRTFEGNGAARETTRRSCQPSQVVSQLGVVGFDRVGIRFTFRNFIPTKVIPQAIIGIECVTVILLCLGGFIHHFLDGWLSTLPNDLPAQITACSPVYTSEDVDPVFLLPIKVNNSSISASFTSSGKGASGKLAACALTHNETVR